MHHARHVHPVGSQASGFRLHADDCAYLHIYMQLCDACETLSGRKTTWSDYVFAPVNASDYGDMFSGEVSWPVHSCVL